MAPVTATSTGIPRQFIDDPELFALLERLSSYDVSTSKPIRGNSQTGGASADADTDTARVDVEGLVGELERWTQWKFQEMVSYTFEMRRIRTTMLPTYASCFIIICFLCNRSNDYISIYSTCI